LQAIFCHGKKKKKSNERHPEKKRKSKKNQTRKIKKKTPTPSRKSYSIPGISFTLFVHFFSSSYLPT